MKDEKVNDRFDEDWSLTLSSRKALRDAVVSKFLQEKGGFWKGGVKHVTNFRYFVETISDGRRVYLLRPTHLNKGIDFQVWVERLVGAQDKRPKHQDIFDDLQAKRKESPNSPNSLNKLLDAIDAVWLCKDPDEVLKNAKLRFTTGWPTEMLLKVLKWLFIEQDVTYWNYDGRGMLRMAINDKLDVMTPSEPMKEFFGL